MGSIPGAGVSPARYGADEKEDEDDDEDCAEHFLVLLRVDASASEGGEQECGRGREDADRRDHGTQHRAQMDAPIVAFRRPRHGGPSSMFESVDFHLCHRLKSFVFWPAGRRTGLRLDRAHDLALANYLAVGASGSVVKV